MTIQKLYEKFQECKTVEDFQEVMKDLEDMASLEAAKEYGQGSQLSGAKAVLKEKFCKSRPILQKGVIIDGKQVFTDAYCAFVLKNHIVGLPMHDPGVLQYYPNVLRFFHEWTHTYNVRVGMLKEQIGRLGKEIALELDLQDGHKVALDKKKIVNIIKVLGLKNNETINMGYKDIEESGYTNKAIIFWGRSLEDKALLLPLRRS